MGDYVLGSHAETATCAEGPRQGADDHFNLRRVDVLRLGDATTRSSEDTKRPGLVENHTELVLLFQLDLAW